MVKIPIRLLQLNDNGFHLLVEVVVFDRAFVAVLDTGASHTVFDKHTVEQYLPSSTVLEVSDMPSTGLGTNTMESYSLVVPALQIGVNINERIHLGLKPNAIHPVSPSKRFKPSLTLKNFEVAALDLSTINYAYGQLELEPIIGVIGGDILMHYGGIINYRTLTLTLRERKLN